MQLINLLPAVLLLASQGTCAPVAEPNGLTPNNANVLLKRANPAPVSCGRKFQSRLKSWCGSWILDTASDNQRAWPLQSVQDAFNGLVAAGNLPDDQKRKTFKSDSSSRLLTVSYQRMPAEGLIHVSSGKALDRLEIHPYKPLSIRFPSVRPVWQGPPNGSNTPLRTLRSSQVPLNHRVRTASLRSLRTLARVVLEPSPIVWLSLIVARQSTVPSTLALMQNKRHRSLSLESKRVRITER